jgi:mannose-6-phosphate isomerase-like protein (cupin superfamily)
VLARKVEYTVGDETFVAEAPYVVRIPAGVWHSFKNIGGKMINVIGVFPKSRESEVDYK